MKHSLQLKLSQHLTLTPQLQQSIRLLQLSTLELNQEVDTYLRENPMLELADGEDEDNAPEAPATAFEAESQIKKANGEEAPADEYRGDDYQDSSWWEEASTHGGHDEDEESDYSRTTADKVTLRQHLHWQLSLSQLSDRDKILVSMLIDALDEDGYLTQSLEELVILVPPELRTENAEEDDLAGELATALKLLQSYDPPGVGARNLAECLTLQLDNLPVDTPQRELAHKIAAGHLEVLAARDFSKLKKTLKCSDDELREAHKLIRKLNPRPASDFAVVDTRYIIPDVIVRKVKGLWQVSLNPEAMPKLRLNRVYADILTRNRDASLQQLSAQLQEAKWLIKNVQQRFDTILRVSQAIVERQRHFFDHGEVAMRPLVLREIAEEVDLHESTVSRVTTQKFMMTPRGVYELKYFFCSHVATEAGGACSATAIRALIKQMVGAEDQKNPLSDSQITDILANQGIMVARRTIAKYRESLQIPAVNLRKSL